jgi:hypothetical protein
MNKQTSPLWVFRAVMDSSEGPWVLLVSAGSIEAAWGEVSKLCKRGSCCLRLTRSVRVA